MSNGELVLAEIPELLRVHRRFVPYKLIPVPGKRPRKVPQRLSAHGFVDADSTAATNWLTWDEVTSLHGGGACRHFGWAFTANETGIICIDVDECRDAETGLTAPWALDLAREIDSFTEISPSGSGLHVWVEVDGDSHAIGKANKVASSKSGSRKVEVFSNTLWVTLTGNVLPEIAK